MHPPEHLPASHPEGLRRLDLGTGHRIKGPADGIRGKGPIDDGEGQDRQQEAIDFMHPLRIGVERQLGRGADDKVIALADRLAPVRAHHLVTQIFKSLVDGQRHEQEEDDLGNAAHHGDIGAAKPAKRCDPRAACQRPAKAEQQGCRRGDDQQKQHRPEGQVERHMLAGGQIAGKPGEAGQG